MKLVPIILLLLIPSLTARGQITLTEQDYLAGVTQSSNQTTYYSTDTMGVRALENLDGPNVTWDFSGRAYTVGSDSNIVTLLSYPGGAPLANDTDFIHSTNAVKSSPINPTRTTIYTFLKITTEGLWELGVVADSAGIAYKVSGFNPPLQQLAFPLIFHATWNSTSSAYSSTLPPGGTLTIADTDTVDGWGMLQVPQGQSVPALRVKKTLAVSVSAFGFSATTTSYAFIWYTKSGYGASINADSEFRPTTVSYATPSLNSVVNYYDPGSDPLTIRLSSNPISNTTTHLIYKLANGGIVRESIMDELGAESQILWHGNVAAGEHDIPIDPIGMKAGVYFLRIQANGSSALRKLIIQ